MFRSLLKFSVFLGFLSAVFFLSRPLPPSYALEEQEVASHLSALDKDARKVQQDFKKILENQQQILTKLDQTRYFVHRSPSKR